MVCRYKIYLLFFKVKYIAHSGCPNKDVQTLKGSGLVLNVFWTRDYLQPHSHKTDDLRNSIIACGTGLLDARDSVVVKALCYKQEGRGFDSR
jgi:hypothetical protein